MPTVPAAGQFGPDQFTVQSLKGQTVDAKFLRDTTGQNYIIDPLSQRPYVVPLNYNPAATAAYFANKANEALATAVPDANPIVEVIYPELKDAF